MVSGSCSRWVSPEERFMPIERGAQHTTEMGAQSGVSPRTGRQRASTSSRYASTCSNNGYESRRSPTTVVGLLPNHSIFEPL